MKTLLRNFIIALVVLIQESLRPYPSVPLPSRQACAEDRIRNRRIGPGSIILIIPWLLHRHEEYWEKPESFIPERFLPGPSRPDKLIDLPFGVGHRVFLGLRFGLTEGILCLATLVQRYQASALPGHKVEIECRLTLRPKGGLPMVLTPRRS